MEPTNPYAPPKVALEGGEALPTYGAINLLSVSGRLGRARYLVYNLGAALLLYAVMVALMLVLGSKMHEGAVVLFLTVVALWLPVQIILGVQRLHDIGLSGWALFALLIPLAGSLFALYMSLAPGAQGPNPYGPPPPPNSFGVLLVTWLVVGLAIAGIVAAIAVPLVATSAS